jgi:type I restriction-modification system DNA methylase subunit
MAGLNRDELESKLKELIKAYEDLKKKKPSERDVQTVLVEPLFQALGWDSIVDCKREAYLPATGFVDLALNFEHDKALLVECKRLEKIPTLAERKGDRTPEEKQAMKYAHGRKMPYAILTNFERLHVFNADREVLILAFDKPVEYLTRIDKLLILSRERVAKNSLYAEEAQLEKQDVDLVFLKDLKKWRMMLVQSISKNNPDNPAILDREKKNIDFTSLLRIVQRILDRLILIEYADEKALIGKQGKFDIILQYYDRLSDYSTKDPGWVQDDFNKLCHAMDDEHNTTIFAKDDACEKVLVDNDTFVAVMQEMEFVSFRKFSWDVLGNTYESYLGHKLELRKGKIVSDTRKELRKGKGIYYTPPRIVKYIVQQTLGRKLDDLYQKYGMEAIKHVKKIKVIDPACGSGTFLIAAFETLAEFYKKLNDEIEAERRRIRESQGGDMFDQEDNAKHLPKKVLNPAKRILEKNIYGVDLDPEAAEYATVNVIMRAFEHRGNGQKLPLILNHNIKVGNSLVAGIHPSNTLENHADSIASLIEMRNQLGSLENSEKSRGWNEISKLTKKISYKSNKNIQKNHPKLQYDAFNWQVEFPEVFFKKDGSPKKNPGFDVVIGNPPYVRQESLGEFKDFLKEHFKSYHGVADIYVYFFEHGIDILKQDGLFGFISSNKFVRSNYGGPLREFIVENAPVTEIVDFGELPIFHDASPFPAIFILQKTDSPPGKISFTPVRDRKFETVFNEVDKHRQTLSRDAVSGDSWTLASDEEIAVLKKMESKGTPLGEYLKEQGAKIEYGIKTGFNKAFIIDRETRNAFIKEDPKSEEIIKPLIIGDDVRRYHVNYQNRYLIWTYKGIDIKKYPGILKHLKQYKKELEKRWDKGDHWYELRACDYYDDFLKPKIVYPDIAMRARFASDKSGMFLTNTAYMLPVSDIHLLPILNSRLGFFWFSNKCTVLGDTGERGRLRLFNQFVNHFPIPSLEGKDTQPLPDRAERITEITNQHHESLSLFAKHVNNYTHTAMPLNPDYWLNEVYSPLMKKRVVVDSDFGGEVTGISIREEGERLCISAVVDKVSTDIVEIEIEDEDFRLFFYYSIRSFLDEHSSKRKWGEGRAAEVVLKSLEIPFFRPVALDDHERNLSQIKFVMNEFRAEAPILHITEAEDETVRLEREIDETVYKLYGLAKEEIAVVESKVR